MEYQFLRNRIPGGVGADDRFWESLEEGHFRLCRCADCKAWQWPPHFRCAACGGWEQEWVDRELRGTLFTWTRTHMAFETVRERAGDLPYTVGVVEIPDTGGARVIGILDGDTEHVRIGRPVHGVIDPPSEKTKGYATVRWILDREEVA